MSAPSLPPLVTTQPHRSRTRPTRHLWATQSFAGIVRSTLGAILNPIAAGALPTVVPVSGAAFQCSLVRDVFLVVPVTFSPLVGASATCAVAISPDGVTYSALATKTFPVGVVFDGSIDEVSLPVPAGWYVRLTVVNAVLGTGTYY